MGQNIAPGARVVIRDAEWRVKRKDQTSDSGFALRCEGLSELVRGKDAIFLTKLEDEITVLEPEETELVADTSPQYAATQLYLDTMLRQFVPNDERLYVGQHAAMDQIPYQLDPARQALSQPRQRILIADSVGLGKTLSAGILTSELIARGRGKRILVLATKAMLSQFQQEFFNRFTIPLVRLDSVGLQRVRNLIPTNHNPFHYYDRSIISIDTLKQDAQYRHYLEKAYWDIIIIDEAHNVAERSTRSQRARLAQLLAKRSDTLIMLSATPHDGRPESFASLMNMLDPTAIVDTSNYQSEDFRDKGLVIRRFKKDVAAQLSKSFPERDIRTISIPAALEEEALYDALSSAKFHTLDGRGAGQLFRTTLTKILLSSPAAFISTVRNRRERLQKLPQTDERTQDLKQLDTLEALAEKITPEKFSKFQRLVDMLSPDGPHSEGWNTQASDDRMVVFTESVKTLEFLEKNLPKALKLKKDQVRTLSGQMTDVDISATVDAFNRKDDPVRLLLCSDVASEGINLHHLSHRLIHFDIPWSLMLFQQRNGRIDRYGQTEQPLIRYLTVQTDNAKLKGDARVLEVLIEKDEQAAKNIGDPSEFGGRHTVEEQEELTKTFMEKESGADDLMAFLDQAAQQSQDVVDAFTPVNHTSDHLETLVGELPRIFPSDDAYMRAALNWLSSQTIHGDRRLKDVQLDDETLSFSIPADLKVRLRYLPKEAIPQNNRFQLTANKERIARAMSYTRNVGDAWADVQFLWPLHPAVEWAQDRALNAFGRHAAPVIERRAQLPPNHAWVLLHGGYPNARGQFILQDWQAIEFLPDGSVGRMLSIQDFLTEFPMDKLVNPGSTQDDLPIARLQSLLPTAVTHMRSHLDQLRTQHLDQSGANVDARLAQLAQLEEKHLRALEGRSDRLSADQEQRERSKIDEIFDDYERWIRNTQQADKNPYIQVAALIIGETQ